ncbi:MAG: cytoplasmic protein [Chloroflexi bacterium]|nr:cytoplasmic protein [Chloroflexota bacterium]
MPEIVYSINDEVFRLFPNFIRGVLVARDVQNRPSPQELIAIMQQEEDNLREALIGQEIVEHPLIHNWREAFRSLGIKPSEFRSSIEALARRVVNGNQLPSINALVDIGNIISLRHLLPTGGHALDHVKSEIELRPASGDEVFVPFGSEISEHPEPGEIIFAEGNDVLTRRWVWRQSNHTLTELGTRFIEFNLDGLPPADEAVIHRAGDDLAELVKRFCGGSAEIFLLSDQNRRIAIG